MADQFTIQIDDRKVQRAFAKLSRKLQRRAINRAARAAAKVILPEARARVPVDEGKLKRSLKVRAGKKKKRGEVKIVVTTNSSESLFTGETYYGGFIEFGTRNMPAKPFMRPAFEAKKNPAIQAARTVLRAEVLRGG